MTFYPKGSGALVLRLIVALVLLGGPRIAGAAGTWSLLSLPQKPGDVFSPLGVAVDVAGNLYVADLGDGGRIQERDVQGRWTVIAPGGTGLGQVFLPYGLSAGGALAVDAAGSLYVADAYRVQKRDAHGHWSLLSGPGTPVQVSSPTGLAVDTTGNLYVADGFNNGRLLKRGAQGTWSVLANQGTGVGQVDSPTALAVDAAGNLYVGEWEGRFDSTSRIQKRNAQGNWSVIATGRGTYPRGLAVDAAGSLYVADYYSNTQKRDAQGNWLALGAGGNALALDSTGNLYVAQGYYPPSRIQKRDAQGTWSVIAATGDAPGQLLEPGSAAVDGASNLFLADHDDNYSYRIQRRDAHGSWSVIAVPADGRPSGLAADAAGNLYLTEYFCMDACFGFPIWKRDVHGSWSAIAAGDGDLGQVYGPTALAVDTAGNLYAADQLPTSVNEVTFMGRIQKRDAQGHWSVIAAAGTGLGQVYEPTAVAVDAAGNLYVADRPGSLSGNGDVDGRIQKRDAQGNWSILATAGDAPGQVDSPTGLAVGAAGDLYVADGGRIQKRDSQGHWSVLATAGSDTGQVSSPTGLAVDAVGRLYVADQSFLGGGRVQEYTATGDQ
jgi:DNA-binding beta-propeller fold protein YncE